MKKNNKQQRRASTIVIVAIALLAAFALWQSAKKGVHPSAHAQSLDTKPAAFQLPTQRPTTRLT